MKIAIIDLGTNSVRFDVYRIGETPDKKWVRVHREKEMVRLGDGLFQTGRLDGVAVERTVRAFENFSRKIEIFGVQEVAAYATSALRDAKNPERLTDWVQKKTGIRINVISGAEEAKLIADGILEFETLPSDIFALVDIGGGSTEISICEKGKFVSGHSFDLGSNRLQQVFLRSSPPQSSPQFEDPIQSFRAHVDHTLRKVMAEKQWPKVRSVIGSSGTAKALRKLVRKAGYRVEPFRTKDLKVVLDRITPLDLDALAAYPGMELKRTDLIVSGGVLMHQILETFEAKKVFTTEYALRDGLLNREIQRLRAPNVTLTQAKR